MIKNGMRPVHPGEILREDYLVPLGTSANALAKALNVPAPRINDIVRERRGVSADTAMRLARYFGGDASEVVPRRCTLDGFAEEVALTEGINVREAEPLVPIVVTTQNSVYRIIPLRWGDAGVLVQGGQFFPEPTEAYLAGSTFGGSFLKMYWIGIGMHMEINTGDGGGPIITTRVASVRIEPDQTTKARRH